MHICPQEIMMILGSVEQLRFALPMVKHWCASCFNGTHKSCEDHAAAVALESGEVPDATAT